jgi:hypothetical protein
MDYKDREKAMTSAFLAAKKKASDNQVLKNVAKPEKQNEQEQMLCDMAHRLLHESLDMFKDGEMTFAEAMDDFASAAKAIDVKDLKVTGKPSKETATDDESGAVPMED